ncbi:MAG: hypothetical protein Q9170_004005 [Blastenia crenularia]
MVKRSREDSPPASDTDSTSPSPSPSTAETCTHPDDPRSTKYLQVADEHAGRKHVAMKCSLAPHSDTLTFSTFEEFEVHYAKVHTNRCSECHKNFPTEHFLSLHISENHDPLIAARKAREEKTYRCFVEGCDKICSNPQKRRMHLQAKHFFPKDYDIFIVNGGIDKRSSMLRTRNRRRSSAAHGTVRHGQKSDPANNLPSSPKTVTQDRVDAQSSSSRTSDQDDSSKPTSKDTLEDVDDLATTMSALKLVPPSVRFGRGGRRAGLGRR